MAAMVGSPTWDDHVPSRTFEERAATSHPPTSNSLSGMLSTLIPNLIIAGVLIGFFLFVRARQRRIYQPRTYLGSLHDFQKTPRPSSTLLGWFKDFWSLPDEYVLSHQSLDGYLYLRFFRTIVIIFFVSACISWPILFPVYATGGGGGQQFDLLSMANAPGGATYLAPCLVGILVLSFVIYMIARESIFYIYLRQAYLVSPYVASKMSSRTVLFTDVPQEYLNEERLRHAFAGIEHIWLATDCKDLMKLVDDRDKTAMKLEGAEVKLSRDANANRIKTKAPLDGAEEDPMRWVDQKKRPTHKLKPLIGEKVDTIDWSRKHLSELIPKIEAEQAKHFNGDETPIPAVFIEFTNVQAAQSAYQQLVFHKPKVFQPRAIGVTPDEIVWGNLSMSWWQRDVRYTAATAFITAMIVFWAIPVAFIGLVSNVNYLETISFLTWIKDIPKVILGVVTGLLPVVALAVLMALVPIFCRLLAKLSGAISLQEIELQTQSWYFAFLVIQVFLITTVASAATAVAKQIASNPGSVFSLLAINLPKSSNFYINYFCLYGVGAASGVLANVAGLVVFYLLGMLLDKTPRKKYNRYTTISGLGWGSVLPVYSNLAVIAITYSVIAPLVLGFAFVSMLLMYIATRYQLFYILDTQKVSTQGAAYAKAIQQLMVGVYLAEVCLIGLFATQVGGKAISALPLVLMILFLILTILVHSWLRGSLHPLVNTLPRDLLELSTERMAHDSQRAAESGVAALGQHTAESEEKQVVVDGTNGQSNGVNGTTVDMASPSQSKPKTLLQRLLHPSTLPVLAPHMSVPVGAYSDDVRREAYLNSAITSPTPTLWFVHDDLGVSNYEKEQTGKVIGCTDSGAWWDEKNKLAVGWATAGLDEQRVEETIHQAPIYERSVQY